MITLLKKLFARSALPYKGRPYNAAVFNEKFVAANEALAKGNTEGLKRGLTLFIESLAYCGDFGPELIPAIQDLRCALSHHDRADTKGPWNRDLSGYGVLSWKSDIWDRNDALLRAWPHINKINQELKKQGLGWR